MAKKTAFETYIEKAFKVTLSPGNGTARAMSMRDSLIFYYSIMVIPLILGVLIRLLLGGPAAAGLLALSLIVIVPISLFVNSFIYHIVIGKLFNLYKSDYWKVFSAFTYGVVPVVLVYWFISIPILGGVIVGLSAIWGYIVQIIALSNILHMTRLKAFATTLLSGAVVAIIIGLVSLITTAGVFVGMHALGV